MKLYFSAETAHQIETQKNDILPKRWIADIFAEAENKFTIHPDANERCSRDFDLYKSHLKNESIWAIRSKLKLIIFTIICTLVSHNVSHCSVRIVRMA